MDSLLFLVFVKERNHLTLLPLACVAKMPPSSVKKVLHLGYYAVLNMYAHF
jgi:hypothetical protein